MAKETDQTQTTETNETETQEVTATEQAEDQKATEKAVKTSEDFDKLADEEGVEETPSEDETSEKTSAKDETKADEKDTGETEETAEETPGEEDTGKISPELNKRAIDLGLTPEEIEQFSSDEELEKTVKIIETVISEDDDEPKPGTQELAPGKPKEKEEPESVLKFENEDEIDPEILKAMKGMEKQYQSKIDELSEQVKALQTGVQQNQQNEFVKRFDKMVDDLGIDFVDTFGKGSTNDLSKRSTAFKNRDNVRKRMYGIAKGLVEAGESPPDEQKLFDIALNSLYGEKVSKVKGLKTSKKTQEYVKGSRVQRPASNKKTGNLTPMQRAVQTQKKFDEMIDTSED